MPNRRLKIGYVSGDFRDHPVAQFVLPLLTHHDREHFEIFGYSAVAQPDPMTASLAAKAAHWRDVVSVSDDALAEQIRADGITDALADPVDDNQNERLMRVACAWCYVPAEDSPPLAPRNADRPITFGCFNNFAKVTPEMIQTWARILEAVPNARLLIKSQPIADEATRAAVHEHLRAAGIPNDRLQVLPRVASLREHLATYSTIDIALDTFPYHGTTTTCDAMYMGVPVITLAGEKHVSRVGVSLLSNVNLQELIAKTPEEYAGLAIELANDRSRLATLHTTLRERMKSSRLMDASAHARDVEAAYRRMWTQWCES
jgi:predicted O-linked N-acetylglucosamine transferase (SPINDLY family)